MGLHEAQPLPCDGRGCSCRSSLAGIRTNAQQAATSEFGSGGGELRRVCRMNGDMGDLKSLLARVAQGRGLSESEAEAAFDIIMSGDATPSQMGGFLMALRVRGETVDEITGAARTMRARAVVVDAPPGTIDTCGTGGDASGSFNISTASALVVAGCG